MGPYTPAQLAVAAVGGFFLIKTAQWWLPVAGPVPVAAWGLSIWAVRHSRIAGRSPLPLLLDALSATAAPRSGRIGGRRAGAMRPVLLSGGFRIEEWDAQDTPVQQKAPVPAPAAARTAEAEPAAVRVPRAQAAPASRRKQERSRPAPRTAADKRPQAGPELTPLQKMLAAAGAAQTSETRRDHQ
ncbi:hypothetical protein [Streptomyces sp. NRRL B-24484]|uniref:hypothetical protein n=1 Tax=Streptomyces sp. NRRL B-24484 TaxID=1463833 RepID=UPI001F31757E|nr:hypothetical protein [Streptomyces sp. NRRL B-24484]